MSQTAGVLDAPTLHDAQQPDPDPPPLAGAVAVVIDASVAAIAAAAWAGRLAAEAGTSVLVVALTSRRAQRDDLDAVLARVQPTLARAGRPCTVRVCELPGGATPGGRDARAARRVLALLPPDVSLLVCPAGAGGFVQRLAVDRPVDLLVVPDLRSLPDATATVGPAAPSAAAPAGSEDQDTPCGSDGDGPAGARR